MNAMETCRIDTGDFVGSQLKGPKWTPYAEAIAGHYPIQVPWYITKKQTLTLSANALSQVPFTQTLGPQLYDTLIMGMSAICGGSIATLDNGNYIYLNITDLETGIPWCAPNMIGYAPVLAYAGAIADPSTGTFFPTPVSKLPETYFLPRGTRLKLDWFPIPIDYLNPVNLTVTLTMIGVQLINPKQGSKAPSQVTMPNGDQIPVGSRVPWFGCVPFGRRPPVAGSRALGIFTLPAGEQATQFLPPIDCNVELHDAYANFLASTVLPPAASKPNFVMKLSDMRSVGDWTPQLSPASAVFGNEEYVFPQMPFVMPHLLRTGHRSALVFQNNDTSEVVTQGSVTLRGVRLCEY
jgi:hypothetical protein